MYRVNFLCAKLCSHVKMELTFEIIRTWNYNNSNVKKMCITTREKCWILENTEQNNFEYLHFLRSANVF